MRLWHSSGRPDVQEIRALHSSPWALRARRSYRTDPMTSSIHLAQGSPQSQTGCDMQRKADSASKAVSLSKSADCRPILRAPSSALVAPHPARSPLRLPALGTPREARRCCDHDCAHDANKEGLQDATPIIGQQVVAADGEAPDHRAGAGRIVAHDAIGNPRGRLHKAGTVARVPAAALRRRKGQNG